MAQPAPRHRSENAGLHARELAGPARLDDARRIEISRRRQILPRRELRRIAGHNLFDAGERRPQPFRKQHVRRTAHHLLRVLPEAGLVGGVDDVARGELRAGAKEPRGIFVARAMAAKFASAAIGHDQHAAAIDHVLDHRPVDLPRAAVVGEQAAFDVNEIGREFAHQFLGNRVANHPRVDLSGHHRRQHAVREQAIFRARAQLFKKLSPGQAVVIIDARRRREIQGSHGHVQGRGFVRLAPQPLRHKTRPPRL